MSVQVKVRLHTKAETIDCTIGAEPLEDLINEMLDADHMLTITLQDGSMDSIKVSDIEAYNITDEKIRVKEEKRPEIQVIVKEVGKPAELRTITNEYESFVDIVGGHLQMLNASSDGLCMYCDEEAKLKANVEPNFNIPNDTILGNVVFFRSTGEYEDSVNKDDLTYVSEMVTKF